MCAVWVGVALRDAVGVWLLRRNALGFWCGLGMAWFVFCCQILLQKSLHLTPLLHRSLLQDGQLFPEAFSREISACHDFSQVGLFTSQLFPGNLCFSRLCSQIPTLLFITLLHTNHYFLWKSLLLMPFLCISLYTCHDFPLQSLICFLEFPVSNFLSTNFYV